MLNGHDDIHLLVQDPLGAEPLVIRVVRPCECKVIFSIQHLQAHLFTVVMPHAEIYIDVRGIRLLVKIVVQGEQ